MTRMRKTKGLEKPLDSVHHALIYHPHPHDPLSGSIRIRPLACYHEQARSAVTGACNSELCDAANWMSVALRRGHFPGSSWLSWTKGRKMESSARRCLKRTTLLRLCYRLQQASDNRLLGSSVTAQGLAAFLKVPPTPSRKSAYASI